MRFLVLRNRTRTMCVRRFLRNILIEQKTRDMVTRVVNNFCLPRWISLRFCRFRFKTWNADMARALEPRNFIEDGKMGRPRSCSWCKTCMLQNFENKAFWKLTPAKGICLDFVRACHWLFDAHPRHHYGRNVACGDDSFLCIKQYFVRLWFRKILDEKIRDMMIQFGP